MVTLATQKIDKKEKAHLIKKAKLTNSGTIREALRELIKQDMETSK